MGGPLNLIIIASLSDSFTDIFWTHHCQFLLVVGDNGRQIPRSTEWFHPAVACQDTCCWTSPVLYLSAFCFTHIICQWSPNCKWPSNMQSCISVLMSNCRLSSLLLGRHLLRISGFTFLYPKGYACPVWELLHSCFFIASVSFDDNNVV